MSSQKTILSYELSIKYSVQPNIDLSFHTEGLERINKLLTYWGFKHEYDWDNSMDKLLEPNIKKYHVREYKLAVSPSILSDEYYDIWLEEEILRELKRINDDYCKNIFRFHHVELRKILTVKVTP